MELDLLSWSLWRLIFKTFRTVGSCRGNTTSMAEFVPRVLRIHLETAPHVPYMLNTGDEVLDTEPMLCWCIFPTTNLRVALEKYSNRVFSKVLKHSEFSVYHNLNSCLQRTVFGFSGRDKSCDFILEIIKNGLFPIHMDLFPIHPSYFPQSTSPGEVEGTFPPKMLKQGFENVTSSLLSQLMIVLRYYVDMPLPEEPCVCTGWINPALDLPPSKCNACDFKGKPFQECVVSEWNSFSGIWLGLCWLSELLEDLPRV